MDQTQTYGAKFKRKTICVIACQDVPNCSGEIDQVNIQYKIILGEYDQLSGLEEYPTESYMAVEVMGLQIPCRGGTINPEYGSISDNFLNSNLFR